MSKYHHFKNLLPINIDWNDLLEILHTYPGMQLLESQEDSLSDNNRYSIVGLNSLFSVTEETDGRRFIQSEQGEQSIPDALGYISDFLEAEKNEGEKELELPFYGGFIGFLSYDRQSHMPMKVKNNNFTVSKIGLPLLKFYFFINAVVHDLKDNKTYVTSVISPDNLSEFKQKIIKLTLDKKDKIKKDKENTFLCKRKLESKFDDFIVSSSTTRDEYLNGLSTVHEDIGNGNVYQINYTQRFFAPYAGDYWTLYKKLRYINPAPYAAVISDENWQILSSSPELFLHKKGRQLVTKPIKGTIKRTDDFKCNKILQEKLHCSTKDRSELLMITDLERNDLGKICVPGSVKVPALFDIETYPTLYHLISVIEGQIVLGTSFKQIIEATFPGGSITGAPKLAAIAEIARLEKAPREIYTGAIGWIDVDGDFAFNIVIRTMIIKGCKVYFSAGGGIVWDSDNNAEYDESLLKAWALKEALCL